MSRVIRLERITLMCAAPLPLADFYATALGFTQTDHRFMEDRALGEMLGLPMASAQVVTLQLGEQYLELVALKPRGHAYPAHISGTSGLFQHFAIEVEDIDRAMQHLREHPRWTAISTGGPQHLPAASGGVTAFKFRDPEGHPLELIAAARPASGLHDLPRIDHSAISVASDVRSAAFYERLGLVRTGGSLNMGPEQARLDDIPGARVAVTALSPALHPVPHLELLCYGERFVPATPTSPNDIAATWLVFTVASEAALTVLLREARGMREPVRFADGVVRSLLQDPDGHWLCLEVARQSAQPPVAKPG
jgi:catechol 2,3-dioxygenase-like lactoylglutathione lyase family enzyme